jgi:DNA polymerase
MLIGEAPGKDEDLRGRPFVGRAGKLLDSALEAAGVSRKELFITNVVKCRPPKNRLPTSREISICKDAHLMRQIDATNPDLVVLLGRTAASAMLDAKSLGEVMGKPTVREGVKYIATYHPAAVLRNPHLRRRFAKDLRKTSVG